MAACVVVAILINASLFWTAPPDLFAKAMLSSLLLPIVLTGPLIVHLLRKLQHLTILNQELHASARTDSLTQVLNRGAFAEQVAARLTEMDGCTVTRGAFLVLDADYFKKVNDHWGHSVGDRALTLIAGQMLKVIHRDDVVGRLGGEEFGIFLYGSGRLSSRNIAERLRMLVEAVELRSDDGHQIRLSVSIGAVHFCEILPFATLYKLADAKLYDAKAKGRNRVEFVDLDVGTLIEHEAAA